MYRSVWMFESGYIDERLHLNKNRYEVTQEKPESQNTALQRPRDVKRYKDKAKLHMHINSITYQF